jgi:DNA-binding transcriptional ArsR family regulator
MTIIYGKRYERVPAMFKALSCKTSRAVLHLLVLGLTSQSEIARLVGVTQPTVSRHIARLARAGLVQRSDGLCWVDPRGVALFERFVAEHFRRREVSRDVRV